MRNTLLAVSLSVVGIVVILTGPWGFNGPAKADDPKPDQSKFLIESSANNGLLVLWIFDVENDKLLMYSTNPQGKDMTLRAIKTIKADLLKADFSEK